MTLAYSVALLIRLKIDLYFFSHISEKWLTYLGNAVMNT